DGSRRRLGRACLQLSPGLCSAASTSMLAMSGRIVVAQQAQALLEHFAADSVEGTLPAPSYNVAPGDAVPLVIDSSKAPRPGRRLLAARWGLQPRERTASSGPASSGTAAAGAAPSSTASNGPAATSPAATGPAADAARASAPALLFNARAETVNTAPRFAGL